MEVVIISRKRALTIGKATLLRLPNAKVSIAEEEVDSYERNGVKRKNMLIHPNDVIGVSKKRNWVLKNVEDETVVMVDDDMEAMCCLVGERYRRITDEATIMAIFRNSEACAKGIPCGMFCYNQTFDIRKFNQLKPFSFKAYPSGAVGIIGRSIWYDETNMIHDDVDFALQQMLKFRVVWCDDRFSYIQKTQTTLMMGGCQGFTTQKMDAKERTYLRNKWGKYYRTEKWRTSGVKSHIDVDRQQKGLITPDKI